MLRDERNYHQRLQEFCDCFMETDFRKELERASQGISGDPGDDPEELALKFLGLTFLYGANEDARQISLKRSAQGEVIFSIDARGSYQLPPPEPDLAQHVIAIARAITHIEEDRGEEPFSLGLRSDRLEVTLQFERGKGEDSLSIRFPG
jgi:hypothetical protein